jgi:dTDP-glucose 4,6-dehydratase/UDP-glucose 4-epimerase
LRKQLFWDLREKATQNDVVELFGNGAETRDFIYVADLCRAIELVLQRAAFRGEAINVASGEEVAIAEAAATFFREFAPATTVRFTGRARTGDPDNWRANISELVAMGFAPEHNLQAGIREYVAWLREFA